MGLFHYLWSRTAASNSSADSNVNWAEGMAPSAVNDSARAMMASIAGFRDDIAGAIVTAGTSTAYTVTSYQIFDSLAHMSGQMIAFTPHATNGATVTLNVDGLGAKALRSSTGVELQAGTLIAGTPYTALYNSTDSAWYLHNFYGNPYTVPLGGMLDFIGSTAPNSAFVLPIGQAISRTTYATLFSLVGTTYGTGDGSTTFNVPDLTGRITAMKEATATRITSSASGIDGATLGSTGGAQNVTLAANQIPAGVSSSGSNSISVASTSATVHSAGITDNFTSIAGSGAFNTITRGTITSINGAQAIAVTSTNASQAGFNNMPPTIIVNKILRII